MSYQPWTMPPPMPVDPTNVAGKRIAAWFIDGVVFVILFAILVGALGLGPTSQEVSGDQIRSETTLQAGDEPSSEDATNFCNDWNTEHGGWSAGICLPNFSGTEAEEGTATILKGFGGMGWTFLGLFVVFIVYQGLLGASLGKLALGLRIVRADGSQAGVGASAIRTVLWIVDAITCALPILGGILILTTRGHRRVGDMAAGTYVVPASQVGHPVILPGQQVPGAHPTGLAGTAGPPGGPGPAGGPPPPGQIGPAPSPQIPGTTDPWAPPASPDHTVGSSADSPPVSGPDYVADEPFWDEARGAYIQYDSERAAWLEFDDQRQQWGPIST